jgi:hypothetical protein
MKKPMNKTIIAVHGRASEGKSETIKKVCAIILRDFPNAIPSKTPTYSGDIILAIQIGKIKIGFESQGDPNSRMIYDNTIKKLADKELSSALGGCDIIICATRTGGMTVKEVDKIADKYGYDTLWISSFFSPKLNHSVLNTKAANNIIEIIKSLISEQL